MTAKRRLEFTEEIHNWYMNQFEKLHAAQEMFSSYTALKDSGFTPEEAMNILKGVAKDEKETKDER